MFCAYGKDKSALEALGQLMASVANSEERIQQVVTKAAELGIEFDD